MISWPAVYVLGNGADFLEIFSGCGHLTLGAARQALQLGPSIDKSPGIGDDDAFSINIKKASDRKLVWALVLVFVPTLDSLQISMYFLGSDCSLDAYSTLHFHVSSCTIKSAVGGIRALITHKAARHGIWILYRT